MRKYEITRRDFDRNTDKKSKERSSKVGIPKYQGITPDHTVVFKVGSATEPGLDYTVLCQMSDYKDIADEDDLTIREKVRLAISGDIKVSCSCPAFKYWGYDYIVSQLDSKVGEPEKRYPKIRNPKLDGVLCKHAYRALRVFPMLYMKYVSDLTRDRYLR